MKEYELTVLMHPDLEVDLTPALEKVKKIITENGGEVKAEANEGKKRLAYAIKTQEFAVYYAYELSLPATAPAKISSALNITDEVLRYLLVAVDPRKAKYAALVKQRKASDEEEEEKEEEK